VELTQRLRLLGVRVGSLARADAPAAAARSGGVRRPADAAAGPEAAASLPLFGDAEAAAPASPAPG
jgi:hypothetical protein